MDRYGESGWVRRRGRTHFLMGMGLAVVALMVSTVTSARAGEAPVRTLRDRKSVV
jgi:hypothetical protein